MREYDCYDTARLLTSQEWEAAAALVPNVTIVDDVWWLKDNTPEGGIYYVNRNGEVMKVPGVEHFINHILFGIRPMFTVEVRRGVDVRGISPGDKVIIKGCQCTVVDTSVCPDTIYALSDKIVCRQPGVNRNICLESLSKE